MSTFVKYKQVLIFVKTASKGGQIKVWWGSGGYGSKWLEGLFKSILEPCMFIQFALTFDGCSSTAVHKREGVNKAGDKVWTRLSTLSTGVCG